MTPAIAAAFNAWRVAVLDGHRPIPEDAADNDPWWGMTERANGHCTTVAQAAARDPEDVAIKTYVGLWLACGAAHWTMRPLENPFLIALTDEKGTPAGEHCDIDYTWVWAAIVPDLIAQSPALKEMTSGWTNPEIVS